MIQEKQGSAGLTNLDTGMINGTNTGKIGANNGQRVEKSYHIRSLPCH